MTRALILACAVGLGFASGCSSPKESSPSFTLLGDDTIIVTGEPSALNIAILQAAFALGDPGEAPGSGLRRLPSYKETSEYRSLERNGQQVRYEHRTIRFETPEGITIETRASYTETETTLNIETSPESEQTQVAYAGEIVRMLRERGLDERP